uniref:GPI transamidase component PIG-T n=1 Tax=Panagrellus redivivus TaxID=6233 RepID=A0A7E4VST5_PANRE
MYLPLFGILLLATCHVACVEEYTEELHLSSLPNDDFSTVFRFVTTGDVLENPNEYLYIPLTIRQFFDYPIDEFHLSMTTGTWRHSQWGLQPQEESPTGISLKAKFKDIGKTEIDKTWSRLVQQVNGVFCSSILEVDPVFTTVPDGARISTNDSLLRYGHLAGEPLCTENIKPFLRLLPCKEKGFASVIRLTEVFGTSFHTLSVRAVKTPTSWRVELFAHFVKSRVRLLSRHEHVAFRVPLTTALQCGVAARQSIVYNLKSAYTASFKNGTTESSDSSFELSSLDLSKYDSFIVQIEQKRTQSLVASSEATPFIVTFSREKSDARSGIMSTGITNNLPDVQYADFMHTIPWQLHVEMDSLQFTCVDAVTAAISPGVILNKTLIPSLIKERPMSVFFRLQLPGRSICTLKLAFTTHLMTALSYPPDSNYGIFVSGPIITVNLTEATFRKYSGVLGSFANTEIKSRGELTEASKATPRAVVLHGEPMLVFLPVPDFSMPFNVIAIVTIVTGFLFGSTFNLTVKIFLPDLETPSTGEKKTGLRRFFS